MALQKSLIFLFAILVGSSFVSSSPIYSCETTSEDASTFSEAMMEVVDSNSNGFTTLISVALNTFLDELNGCTSEEELTEVVNEQFTTLKNYIDEGLDRAIKLTKDYSSELKKIGSEDKKELIDRIVACVEKIKESLSIAVANGLKALTVNKVEVSEDIYDEIDSKLERLNKLLDDAVAKISAAISGSDAQSEEDYELPEEITKTGDASNQQFLEEVKEANAEFMARMQGCTTGLAKDLKDIIDETLVNLVRILKSAVEQFSSILKEYPDVDFEKLSEYIKAKEQNLELAIAEGIETATEYLTENEPEINEELTEYMSEKVVELKEKIEYAVKAVISDLEGYQANYSE